MRAHGLGTNAACCHQAVFHREKYAALYKQIRIQALTPRNGEQSGKRACLQTTLTARTKVSPCKENVGFKTGTDGKLCYLASLEIQSCSLSPDRPIMALFIVKLSSVQILKDVPC